VFTLVACGGDPPQIVDYAPQRGSIDVSTATPIKISFDHDVDRASVESRLHLVPVTPGDVRWINGHQLVYEHTTLRTSTTYEVVLESGYRDLLGNTYTLRHHWSFVTEKPPSLSGSTPAPGDGGVDPAAYLLLDFSRAMDAATLKSALTLNPDVPFEVRLDPSDGRRAIVAPSQLLAPNTAYQIAVNTAALDADGNQLDRYQSFTFTTGAIRPLHHWITFATDGVDGSPGGLWIVDESGFPRTLFDTAGVRSYSWSPSGDSLLIESDAESWLQFSPGTGATPLGFKARWAAPLAAGMGYVYIDDHELLHRQTAEGADAVIAGNVAEASVAPNGSRVAFIYGASNPNQIWGYDVGLRAIYLLATDTAPVFDATWAPTGNRIAYLRRDESSLSLRVKSLTGSAATTTAASGDFGAPAWLSDSTRIVVAAALATPQGVAHKAFVLNVASPPQVLSATAGLPSDPNIDVSSPVPSPDGHQIAFVSGGQVWLMNADGTRPTPLTTKDPASFPYSCRAVAWTRT
jgi:Tol biopolymer transport system component